VHYKAAWILVSSKNCESIVKYKLPDKQVIMYPDGVIKNTLEGKHTITYNGNYSILEEILKQICEDAKHNFPFLKP
jgi:quinolinate synthase